LVHDHRLTEQVRLAASVPLPLTGDLVRAATCRGRKQLARSACGAVGTDGELLPRVMLSAGPHSRVGDRSALEY
jgi:hypothetical protein